MSPLFPSANHNRFVHSLGVYYLARKAFWVLKKNLPKEGIKQNDFKKYEYPFLIAALMHDCGHSPFSHILEGYYKFNNYAKKFLFEHVDDDFKKDYEDREKILKDKDARGGPGPQPHEIFSAALFLHNFKEKYEKIFIDVYKEPPKDSIFVARMITGCKYISPKNITEELENQFIKLINGNSIDLDKLDYILRDTYASGLNNVSIDINRLISSLRLHFEDNNKLTIVFNKSALSVIENVIEARNYFYKWIYIHHTVVYHRYILEEAAKKLFTILSPDGDKNQAIKLIFSKEMFQSPQEITYKKRNIRGTKIYLVNDSDFYSWFKQYLPNDENVEQLLKRNYNYIPLWKTRAEFELYFKTNKERNPRIHLKNNLKSILGLNDLIIIAPKINKILIKENEIKILIRNKIIKYTEIYPQNSMTPDYYFFVYIPRSEKARKDEFIQKLKDRFENLNM